MSLDSMYFNAEVLYTFNMAWTIYLISILFSPSLDKHITIAFIKMILSSVDGVTNKLTLPFLILTTFKKCNEE